MIPAKNNFYKCVLLLLGALAGVVFLATKSPALMARATRGSYGFGDLYRMAKIKRFKPLQPLPLVSRANMDSLDKQDLPIETAPVIFFGDSFGFCDWGERDFETQLGTAAGEKIFSVFNLNHGEIADHPLQFLKSLPPGSPSKRIFVYERVERSLPWIFGNGFPTVLQPGLPVQPAARPGSLRQFEDLWLRNTEMRHEVLLKNSFATFPIIEAWNSAAFEILHETPSDTPLYSLNPPFLFYKEEVNSFRTAHDDQMIKLMADNLARFDHALREECDCSLIFVPVPNKVSLYSRCATTELYDDFLPRLCAAAKQRGIRTVELLPAFQQQTNLLYWTTDTHWNNTGIRIAVEQTMKVWPVR